MATTLVLRRIATPNQLLLESSPCTRAFVRRSSGSSKRWLERQTRDPFVIKRKSAKILSRAAWKLLEINEKHRIFRSGQTVVDLGFAPGAWSQVAIDKVAPGGRVIGVDILPAPPPTGVSTIQGNMKSPLFRESLRKFLADSDELEEMGKGCVDLERSLEREQAVEEVVGPKKSVDVLLSDMLMNTSGIPVRDHVYSIDLCYTALALGLDVLRTQCSFVCKVYRGDEENELKRKLRVAFSYVNMMKPESSRDESKEVYYVARNLKKGVGRKDIFPKEDY